MKRVCTALLIVLCSAVCSPLNVCDISHEEGSFLMALDVCDSSASHASVNADSPAIQEYPCHLLHPACSGYAEVSDPAYKPVVAAFKQERPPQV